MQRLVPLAALAALAAAGVQGAAQGDDPVRQSGPELLTYAELLELSETAQPAGDPAGKLERLLNTPFISNQAYYRGARPKRPSRVELGPVLRAAMWNIERGSEFDLISASFHDSETFARLAAERTAHGPEAMDAIQAEAHLLKGSDVILLNEVDFGMTRTDYRDVTRQLAEALDMNYAFGVEFVEVDRIELGLTRLSPPDPKSAERLWQDLSVDRERYRGLHGTAVLSRYPIRSATIHRLRVCYDWFRKEKAEIARLERGRRMVSQRVFLERIAREVRRGGRMALVVDLAVPESPTGTITVVAPHLENKGPSRCRQDQMRDLLREIAFVRNPVILGGDLNTTGWDGAPTSVAREISKRVRNPRFWASQAINWLSPVTLPRYLAMPSNYLKNYLDPTATHVPFLAPNREAGLFRAIEKFRFADGRAFDFRGDPGRAGNGRGGTLGNSNQRAVKGFAPTFAFKRDFGGLAGRFKLDWFVVKPCIDHPRDPRGDYWLAPHYPRTLQQLNEAVPGQISDHHPITVDLPLEGGESSCR